MAINYGANYIGVDKDRYDAGNKFYSQDRFLQGVGLDKPAITFNSSPDNSGIMSMYPRYPYPPIIPEDGGDGGGFIGPQGNPNFDYETDAYNLNDLTPEEQDLLDASRRGYQPGFKDLGGFMMRNALLGTGFINFTLGANSLKNKEEAFQKDIAQSSDDYSSFGGKGDEGATGANFDGDFATDSASYDLAKGGRVGYSNGGLSKYEIFKLGELGYNTKGGTVTAPFGGIKVLRDILKVNNYAGGGIVGLYR